MRSRDSTRYRVHFRGPRGKRQRLQVEIVIDLATHTTLPDLRHSLKAPPDAARAPARREAYARLGRTLTRFAY